MVFFGLFKALAHLTDLVRSVIAEKQPWFALIRAFDNKYPRIRCMFPTLHLPKHGATTTFLLHQAYLRRIRMRCALERASNSI